MTDYAIVGHTGAFRSAEDTVAQPPAVPPVRTGVPLNSFARVVAFAWMFGDQNLLFADELGDTSRIIFRRQVLERLTAALAPSGFLFLGHADGVIARAKRLLERPKTPALIASLIGIFVVMGALHALQPGHGKTLVAAYLVGSRGTMKHALILGLIVTAAHTAGVYLLGGATLYASQYIVPERLYPWLALLSGVMITGLGLALIVRRHWGRDTGSPVHHSHVHRHYRHGEHSHHHHHHHDLPQEVSLRQLLTLGISGGIVPCPAALVVLLSALALNRVGFGLLLIVAFSIGLAVVLIGIGLMIVHARQFMSRFHGNSRLTMRWLPLASSVFIVLCGVALTFQAIVSAGWITSRL